MVVIVQSFLYYNLKIALIIFAVRKVKVRHVVYEWDMYSNIITGKHGITRIKGRTNQYLIFHTSSLHLYSIQTILFQLCTYIKLR